MYRSIRVCCLVVAAVSLGCGRSADKLPTAKAGGTVTLNGQPVEGANVYFSPQVGFGGHVAYGITDSRGRFQLSTTATSPGAMPGLYFVGVSRQRTEPGKTPAQRRLINELPDQYREPARSGLTAEVKAGERNEFPFDLKK